MTYSLFNLEPSPFYIPNISSCYYCADIGVVKISSSPKIEEKIILVLATMISHFTFLTSRKINPVGATKIKD
nr:hypothetical protein LKV13_04580 [Borrelia sp. BU AG58]